jgi:hypothetical protein
MLSLLGQLTKAATNGRVSQSSGFGNDRDSTPADYPGFSGRPESPQAFVHRWGKHLKFRLNGGDEVLVHTSILTLVFAVTQTLSITYLCTAT